jgi:site-specific DNA-methyltransferase (adenine-specific)
MMNLQLPPHYCKTDVMRSVLVHADCFDVFPYIADKSVNLILCDLPYGTTACKWDSILPFDKLWKEYERIITDNGAIVLTASQPFTSALVMSNPKMFKHEWIWEKQKAANFMNMKTSPAKYHENILVFAKNTPIYNPIMWQIEESKRDKRKTVNHCIEPKESHYGNMKIIIRKEDDGSRYPKSILKIDKSINKNLHPTAKPLELMQYLIKTYSNEDDVVLDNCMGSNTTGLACKELNRQYIGIEKEKAYYDISVKRVSECLF